MDLKEGKKVEIMCTDENGISYKDFPCYIRHHSNGKRFTLAFIRQDKNIFDIGIAITHKSDLYNRKRGREIAIGRAITRPFSRLILSEDNKSLRAAFNFVEEKVFNVLNTSSCNNIQNLICNESEIVF